MDQFTRISKFIVSLFFAFLFLVGCSGGSSKHFRIGVDPFWFPLELDGRENQVTAFSTELLTAIGKIEKTPLVKVSVGSDNLLLGLKTKKYEAMLSSMPPYLFNQKEFSFSDLYLQMGPVLVVGATSSIHGLKQLNGREVAIVAGSSHELLLEKTAGVLIRNFDSIPLALNAIVHGTVDAALIDILPATAYVQDLYQGKLKIVTAPLNDQGLRLITLHNQAPYLIKAFNAGLKKLKQSGEYDKLLKKWGLSTVETRT